MNTNCDKLEAYSEDEKNSSFLTDANVEQIVRASLDAKGADIAVLEMAGLTSIADYFVIVSGRSDRQVQGIANRILDSLSEDRIKPLSVDGIEKGHWVVLDYGSIMVHVFYDQIRSERDLEGFWHSAPKQHLVTEQDGSYRLESAA